MSPGCQSDHTSAPSGGTELVILNQYYAPDVAATGHLLYELATTAAEMGRTVSVRTCFPCYGPPESWKACDASRVEDGVFVERQWTTRLSKDRISGRMLNSLTYLIPLLVRQFFASPKDRVYLYTTNPPFLGIVGAVVSLFRRHRYVVLLHDSYPHIAVLTGKIRRGGIVQRLWDAMNGLIYGRAAQTIVLCDRAKELICRDYGVRPELVHVIHNWADPAALRPIPKSDSCFARHHGLDKKFTLLYSGNLGLYYEFDQLLALAECMRDDPDFRLVFIGAGGRRQHIIDEVERRGIGNVVQVHPYQPFDTLNDSLNACDVSLVTIAEGVEGISFPSKLYSSLAIGKVTMAISERGSELQRIVEGNDVGVWVPLGDVDALVAAVKAVRADPGRAYHMGLRSRELMERRFSKQAAAVEYLKVIDQARAMD